MATISLYVPCYDAGATLRPCLASVLGQTRRPDELLVVDDGSRDATGRIAAEMGFRVLRHERNLGLGAGRNTALEAAGGELLASLDADCVADPEWLGRLEGRLTGDPSLAGVGGQLVESHRTRFADAWRTRNMPQHWGPDPIRDPMFLFGNNNLFRRALLLEAGGYLPALRTNFEDVAMSETLLRLGHHLYYEPQATVRHLRRDSLRSILRANWRWRFFGYRNDIGLRGLARGLRRERAVELRDFLRHDWRDRSPGSALWSLVTVTFAVAMDVRYLLGHRGERRIYDPGDTPPRVAAAPESGSVR